VMFYLGYILSGTLEPSVSQVDEVFSNFNTSNTIYLLQSKHVLTKLCRRGEQTCARPFFCCDDLDFGPMTLKLDRNEYILTTYLRTEKEVARSSHSNVTASITTKIALKVKGQGQISPTSNNF